MNKPTLVARQEFAEKLVSLINESGVPLFVIQPVLDQIRSDIGKAINEQYLKEKAAYEKEKEKEEKVDGKDN